METLTIHGVKPESMLENVIQKRLEALLELAPSDASAESTLRKLKTGYEGAIHIFSSQGKFVASAVGRTIGELLHTLQGQIKNQISDWHDYRFQRE